MVFGNNLNSLLRELRIRAVDVADRLYVHPSLISRWIHGSRELDEYSQMSDRLTKTIVEIAINQGKQSRLFKILNVENDEKILEELKKYLYHNREISIVKTESEESLVVPGMCYKGMDGFLLTVNEICKRAKNAKEDLLIITYITSNQMKLIFAPETKHILEQLCSLSDTPVSLVLEPSNSSQALIENANMLTQYFKSGEIQLYNTPASNVHFCYNFTVWIRGIGLVMAIEPSSPKGSFVSMFIDDAEFTESIGVTLCSFEALASPIVERVLQTAEVMRIFQSCFESSKELYIESNSFSYLGMTSQLFKELMKKNLIGRETIRYQLAKFEKNKEMILNFLERGTCFEIIPLGIFDKISDSYVTTPTFFDFILEDKMELTDDFLAEYTLELLKIIENYSNYNLMLSDKKESDFSEILYLKEDEIVFTQCRREGRQNTVKFDKLTFLYSNLSQLEYKWQNKKGISDREQVKDILHRKVKKGGT